MRRSTIGRWGEEISYGYLINKGYKVVERNLRLGNQELDLVCLFQNKLVVVEVKTKIKNNTARAEDMVDRRKLKNLKLASYKLSRLMKFRFNDLRFDLLALEVDRVAKKVKIRHYKDII